jgi:two-component system, sensor histidine kinase LadS
LIGIDRAANLLELAEDLKGQGSMQRLASIRAQVIRLNRVVDNILLTDPVRGESLQPRIDGFSVAGFLHDVRDALTQDMAARVTISIAPPVLEARGDVRLLALALSNLVDNALRYGPPQSPVRLSASLDGSTLIIAVEDEGKGVSPAVFERLGAPRNADSTGGGGSGLGYYFSKLIVLAHGGELLPANRVGGGFSVSLRLPQ